MKNLHLVCNAHLDPVWIWQWKEGAAEAVSTFRVAADFCEKYDGFVFNHNEALLYEWIEEYEPELFERIKKLVKVGKWSIMGGWYLQPDCTMLSGESFLSQIELGRSYFKEKFGVEPKIAINFDPFGHTKGLVQILKKTGYEGYVFMRPQSACDGDFLWKGFADSEIIGHCLNMGYNTLKGEALKCIKEYIEKYDYIDTGLYTWGVGNHGGGPSKIDLEDINKFMRENKDIKVVHSTMENYFSKIDKEKLPVISKSLTHVMVGCYTSMSRIKSRHRELENKLAVTQKMSSYAELTRGLKYPESDITDIRKNLAFTQFHDILPGSCVKPAEEDALRTMDYALEKCDKITAKAFFALAKGQKKAKDGEIPIMVYNPHPYSVRTAVEVEFMLQNQNWNEGEITLAEVFDENGNRIPCQNEKPEATFSLDWIKKVSFTANLAPSSMNRFDCRLCVTKASEKEPEMCDEIKICGDNFKFSVDKKTGLISEYSKNEQLKIKNSGAIEVYRDDEDPWGMNVKGFSEKIGEFKLLSPEEVSEFFGYNEKAEAVSISEDGEVRTKIQVVTGYKKSVAVTEYSVLKADGDIDINITLYSNEADKCLKFKLDTQIENCRFTGQTAFGEEELPNDFTEATFQKWCKAEAENGSLALINNCLYAGSFKENAMYITLLRTPIYCCHPIESRPYAPHNRFIKHIDMGERSFSFKLTDGNELEKKALFFNEKPVVLSYFPHEEKADNDSVVTIDNDSVMLSLIKKDKGGYALHIFNSENKENTAVVKILGAEKQIELKGFELAFFKFENNKIERIDL